MKRELKAGAGATLLVAGALSVALIGGAGSGSAAGTPSSAYGISAEGLIPLDPTPYVVSTDGKLVEESAIPVAIPGLADVGVINASAQNDHAETSVASVGISADALTDAGLGTALAPVLDPLVAGCNQLGDALTAVTEPLSTQLAGLVNQIGAGAAVLTGNDLVQDTVLLGNLNAVCDTLENLGDLISIGAVTAQCTGHTGSSNVAPINLLGLPVSLPEGVNQALSSGALGALAPVLDLKLNTQTSNADGTFTVTALELHLLDQIHIKVGSATCGRVTTDGPTPTAPSPKPIKTNVPVTG
ncbi:hypothetical protein [Nocardioides cavernaquae]|uniref:Choice-of-anchor G family protein n=1 Tax=Nocardioides cavernaquae TaxID=2321396 RepID=A0A3A5HAE1_9ACTN|nr:hypothetical protein [Nocardioides cavernaquae]RJS47596.1 hypothetical protein D4739_16195 [Nocardioides cavernaquae]